MFLGFYEVDFLSEMHVEQLMDKYDNPHMALETLKDEDNEIVLSHLNMDDDVIGKIERQTFNDLFGKCSDTPSPSISPKDVSGVLTQHYTWPDDIGLPPPYPNHFSHIQHLLSRC